MKASHLRIGFALLLAAVLLLFQGLPKSVGESGRGQASSLLPGAASADPESSQDREPITAQERIPDGLPIPPKGAPGLESVLAQLTQAYAAGGKAQGEKLAQERGIVLEDGLLRVVVELTTSAPDAVVRHVSEVGGVAEQHYGELLQVRVPPEALASLAAREGVLQVRLPLAPGPSGTVSEGLQRMGLGPWQTAGFKGKGAKVGVVDLGFAGYQTRLGSELPPAVSTRSFRADGDITGRGTEHGTAVAEILYDIAPAASFYLVNFQTEVEFAQAVDWLIQQQVDIVSSSVGWPGSGPGDGTGIIGAIVKKARQADILWVQAAGNFGETHWSGIYRDPEANGFHNFAPGDEGNTLRLEPSLTGGELFYRVEIVLIWDDWANWTEDYDLFLLRGDQIVAFSVGFQNGKTPPVERIVYTTPIPGQYWLAIQRFSATRKADFDLVTTVDYTMQYRVPGRSLVIPADSSSTLAVGAIPLAGDVLRPYSSRGPTRDGRLKPDLVAPDGVSTATFGSGAFLGTSASTPHVAGAAALVQGARPSWSASDIQHFLEERAVRLSNPEKNNLYGSGTVNLGQPLPSVILPIVVRNASLLP